MKQYYSILFVLFIALSGYAQDEKKADALKQANNPLANMTALNFHNYYIPKLTNAPSEAYLNNAWVRFAKPMANGRLLLRVSMPLSTIGLPDGNGSVASTSGLGDINAFLSYNFVSKPTATVGVGPLLVAPSATENELGTEKWQGGLAFVAFIANTPVFQFGGLITWQASFAGSQNRENTNLMAVQPFYFWQLGKGNYMRGAPIWAFNIAQESYHVPLALGIGKIVKVGNTVFNLFVEPQYSILHQGTQPQFQIFTGINLQFMKNQ